MNQQDLDRPLWGILGGMGPLASAALLLSLYEVKNDVEQDMPAVLMLSDPTVFDRTDCLEGGQTDLLARSISSRLEQLEAGGASVLLIYCITAHAVVHRLPRRQREKLVMLPDLSLQLVRHLHQPTLVLCTTGARTAKVFEASALWRETCHWLRFPDERDQQHVHNLVYELKRGVRPDLVLEALEGIVCRYEVAAALCGCTEFHLLYREQAHRHASPVSKLLDPIDLLSNMIKRGLRTPDNTAWYDCENRQCAE